MVIAASVGLAGGYTQCVQGWDAAACARSLSYCRKAIEKYHREGAQLLAQRLFRVGGANVGGCYKLANDLIRFSDGQYSEIFLACTSSIP